MNDILTTTQSQPENKKEQIIWEEKNLTEPEKKSENKVELEPIDSTIIIGKEYPINEWKNTTNQKISGIYKIINKLNGKYYVGSAKSVRTRILWGHVWELRNKRHGNRHLQNAWDKYGVDNFVFIFIERIPTNNLLLIEQKYLDIAKLEKENVYNICFTAGRLEVTEYMKEKVRISNKNRIWTPEARQHLSEIHTGFKHSDESKKKMSAANIGKIISEEHKLAVGKASKERIRLYGHPMTGKPRSDETKLKIGKSRTGKCVGNENHFFGKHHTDETRRRISEEHINSGRSKGKNNPMFGKTHSPEVREQSRIRNRDKTIYSFININGETFTGMRHEFMAHSKLTKKNVGDLVLRKYKQSKNWSLIDQTKQHIIKF
jgi:group I intron endonuclease